MKMSVMNVDTIVDVDNGMMSVTRIGIGTILKHCRKLTVHKKVKHKREGDILYFPERVFFKYSGKGRKTVVKILPFYKPKKQ